ncbi:Type II secretion system protein K [Gammaproteobacteria bacterium]
MTARVGAIRGVALITAMLVTALVSLVALDLAARQQLDVRRTSNLLSYDQSLLYAQGMDAWVTQILVRDRMQGLVDHLGEEWAMHLPPLPVDGGTLIGELVDQQGLYNLNNLMPNNDGTVNLVERNRFLRLLVTQEIPEDLAGALADALIDWMDPDQDRRFPGGAEDQDYLLLQPPYRAANAPLRSVSELRLVKGFTTEIYRRIAPFVTALPVRTAINVNTAPLPVLLALIPDLRPLDAEALIEARGAQGYRDAQSFINQPPVISRAAELPLQTIDVKTNWFLAHGKATIRNLSIEFYSLLNRTDANNQVMVRVLQQTQGML